MSEKFELKFTCHVCDTVNVIKSWKNIGMVSLYSGSCIPTCKNCGHHQPINHFNYPRTWFTKVIKSDPESYPDVSDPDDLWANYTYECCDGEEYYRNDVDKERAKRNLPPIFTVPPPPPQKTPYFFIFIFIIAFVCFVYWIFGVMAKSLTSNSGFRNNGSYTQQNKSSYTQQPKPQSKYVSYSYYQYKNAIIHNDKNCVNWLRSNNQNLYFEICKSLHEDVKNAYRYVERKYGTKYIKYAEDYFYYMNLDYHGAKQRYVSNRCAMDNYDEEVFEKAIAVANYYQYINFNVSVEQFFGI